ncbi:MAG: FtsX-like permease family protein [Pseudomonadota bacterium]
MRIFLSWHNTVHNKKRSLAAVAGISFSILLMFMQVGFLDTVKRASTLVYEDLDFDLLMVFYDYEYMNEAGRFDKVQLIQANVVDGVDKVAPLNISIGEWEDPDTEVESSVMIIGIDLDPAFIRNAAIRDGLPSLERTYAVMIDTLSNPAYGRLSVPREARINRLDVRAEAPFSLGMGFYADGAVIVNNQTFYALTRQDPREISFGMIKVSPGADPAVVATAVRSTLSHEIVVFERSQLITLEQDNFVSVMPIGIMVQAGVFVSFCVGAVILFQVLSTEIANHLNEFATLKAAGFTTGYIYGVGFQQAALFAVLSYLPAMAITAGLFYIIHRVTRLPILLTLPLAALILAMSMMMCLISGFLALRKVKKADPADLF